MCAVLIRLGRISRPHSILNFAFRAILPINELPNRKHIFPATVSDFLHSFAHFSGAAEVIKRACLANKGISFFKGLGVFYMSSFVFK